MYMTNGSDFPNWKTPSGEPPRDFLERILTDPRTAIVIVVAALAIWLLSGFYIINPGETGIIRRFGKQIGQTTSGLNYRLPWPIDRVNIVNIERIRRIEIGFRSGQSNSFARNQRTLSESSMLTGDENIVEAQMIVQYKVREPINFLFRLREPEETLHIAAEVALRSTVGRTTIDDALTVGRTKIQTETQIFLQRLMDDYQSGIQVTEVKLQVVDPPDQVKDAFHEVVRAREDRERLINQALGYQEDVIPRARGQAQKVLREAEAYQSERVLKASGDAARFLSLYGEYQKAKIVTRDRLYLETMERILPDAQKMILSPNVNVVPLLGLDRFKNTLSAETESDTSQTKTQLKAKQLL